MDHIKFIIKDTGIGIAADKMENLFKEFTQADSSHSRRFGGTGLGLAIVKKLVRLMNGKVEAKSRLGVGSEFTFTVMARTVNDLGMKVAAVSILCQGERVFHAMIQSGTPCPYNGKIGDAALKEWKKYDKLRPDYEQYTERLKVVEKANKEEAKRLEEERLKELAALEAKKKALALEMENDAWEEVDKETKTEDSKKKADKGGELGREINKLWIMVPLALLFGVVL